jgi:DNA-binding transcriptional regulator GbsR (MarR family)
MNDRIWQFVDATGLWLSKSVGLPAMTGRVLGWLLVCDPPEQTAAQLAEALDASKGSISAATRMLVGIRMVERLHVRGERAERFRLRPEAWDDQIRDPSVAQARSLVAQGLEALEGEPAGRRARLEELDAFYAWYQSRMEGLFEEWQEYKRTNLRGKRHG